MSALYSDLAGKVVLITGGATGIGAALVEGFARQKAVACFLDIAEAEGQALSARLSREGLAAPFLRCDLTRTQDLQATILAFSRDHGPITVLVNNAANDRRHSLTDLTPEAFDATIAVNLRHQFFAAQTVIPMMREAGGGAIINFASVSWMIGGAEYPVYATAKAGVHGFTRALAQDLGRDRIRANTITPGWVMTERQLRLWVDDAARARIAQEQWLPGDLRPDDIANMAVFLASDAARMCTAQNFTVDGGWT
ncbi:SDR family NAD(P)-dependent oxidoreductase [Falsirhodobacter halotolerans]|uniref:SDR family NAD(P)-dependent oxidoreductase n=1 Tax=Falsirhodobacter halotolerans TaxID=1146892 RepID=UPI001FD33E7C|nr:SDR family NAD(P)-dependent oxidoreductase [Falsirhodobacter halotolerans]MCJ8141101.1 SDR family oxidoreductase [Falsirhodobacter halotolerans]